MPPTRTATVALDAAAAAVVRGARRRGERVNVVANGRRVGVLLSVADLDALEDAADMAEVRERLAALERGEETTVPWEEVRARLAALP